MNQFYKNLALWLVISLVMILLFNMMTQKEHEQKPINYTTFLTAVDDGKVAEVTVQGANIEGKYKDDTAFKTYAPDDPESDQGPARQGSHHPGQAGRGSLLLVYPAGLLGADPAADRGLDFLHAPDAVGRRQGDELRQEQGQAPHRIASGR